MKELIIFFIALLISFFLATLTYSSGFKVCKENPEQICKEYEDFIVFLFSAHEKKISPNLIETFSAGCKITTDGSSSDPLNPRFYKL